MGRVRRFDAAMILLDAVVHVLAAPHPERRGAGGRPQPGFSMAAARSLQIGLAAIDRNLLGQAVARISLAEEHLGIAEISRWREAEIDRGTRFVDRPIKVRPFALHLDVGFDDVPFRHHRPLMCVECFQQFWCVPDNPAMDRRVIQADTPLGNHFLQISQAQAVAQVPTNAWQDQRSVKMPAFEQKSRLRAAAPRHPYHTTTATLRQNLPMTVSKDLAAPAAFRRFGPPPNCGNDKGWRRGLYEILQKDLLWA
jgi:hypothetical protein